MPIANAENVKRAIPGLEFIAVDESGHLPQMEQTTAFDAHLFAFLDAHPPGAR